MRNGEVATKYYSNIGRQRDFEIFPGKDVLHIGCGVKKMKGATGVDMLDLDGVDIVQNLDETPWPFSDSSFDIVVAHSVVEHITDLVSLFDEVWRVLTPGGHFLISVPYFRSIDSFTDITHKHFFTRQSLDYFLNDPTNRLANFSYTDKKYKMSGFWYGWPLPSGNPLIRMFKSFILRHSKFYDQYLSLFLPVKVLTWELKALK